jgi:sugar lactone lactonase YvrE
VDENNHRIQKFDTDGKFITKWGTVGSGDGQFVFPSSITVDHAANVYVGDINRIQKFTSDGKFITKWGPTDLENRHQLSGITGIAVDSSGNVYVADFGTTAFPPSINKFSSDGKFITKWGSTGSGDGQFLTPACIGIDNSNNVYVTDNSNNVIQKFTTDGKFISKWGSKGSNDGQFLGPGGISVDSNGNVYVADYDNNRIQVFALQ